MNRVIVVLESIPPGPDDPDYDPDSDSVSLEKPEEESVEGTVPDEEPDGK